jgi:hypothetical protein
MNSDPHYIQNLQALSHEQELRKLRTFALQHNPTISAFQKVRTHLDTLLQTTEPFDAESLISSLEPALDVLATLDGEIEMIPQALLDYPSGLELLRRVRNGATITNARKISKDFRDGIQSLHEKIFDEQTQKVAADSIVTAINMEIASLPPDTVSRTECKELIKTTLDMLKTTQPFVVQQNFRQQIAQIEKQVQSERRAQQQAEAARNSLQSYISQIQREYHSMLVHFASVRGHLESLNSAIPSSECGATQQWIQNRIEDLHRLHQRMRKSPEKIRLTSDHKALEMTIHAECMLETVETWSNEYAIRYALLKSVIAYEVEKKATEMIPVLDSLYMYLKEAANRINLEQEQLQREQMAAVNAEAEVRRRINRRVFEGEVSYANRIRATLNQRQLWLLQQSTFTTPWRIDICSLVCLLKNPNRQLLLASSDFQRLIHSVLTYIEEPSIKQNLTRDSDWSGWYNIYLRELYKIFQFYRCQENIPT